MKNVDETISITPSQRYLPCPAISVIIPLYNSEKYIGECLESILHQTFQNFEVIVVDDCSTDNSVEVVESYINKFDGRLRLAKTEKNSGSGGEPRNIGLKLAGGEYVWFINADDFILLTALDILYNAAKENNAEVVYTGAYYSLQDVNYPILYRDDEGKQLIKDGLEDNLDLRVDDLKGNLDRLFLEDIIGNFDNTWTKFLRRDFLLNNKIFFPQQVTIGEDFIWVINVYCHAKRFLRILTSLYFCRDYEKDLITTEENEAAKQVTHWVSSFVDFMNSLHVLENENEILSENPDYCFLAIKRMFKWFLSRIKDARKDLTSQEIYETLHREFAKNTSDLALPFLFSMIDADRKNNYVHQQTIEKLEEEIKQLKNSPTFPAISVIIPMYNVDIYIGECLESLLNQTFQNFEVIVVDDCSTDKSVKIVESYIPKFDGRLTLVKMEENSGYPGIVRNKGILLSRGEYIQFLDADDTLTITALKELYTLAKDYDADLIHCDTYYRTDDDNLNMEVKSHIPKRADRVKIPTWESDNMVDRVENIIQRKFSIYVWDKFIRRKLILENELFFQKINPGEDGLWIKGLLIFAKKILRVPNVVNVHRLSKDSVTRTERTLGQDMAFTLNPIIFGLKNLDNLMDRHEFFQINPYYRYAVFKEFIEKRFIWGLNRIRKITEDEFYSAIKEAYGEKFGEYDVLISTLFASLFKEKEARADDNQVLRKIAPYINARIDILFVSDSYSADFQIVSISDNKAEITQPEWFQKNGIGYVIKSYAGELEFVLKSTVNGQIRLFLRGNDVRDPKYKKSKYKKRIPYWIDYTKLTVNDLPIFANPTPAWHDKSYRHNMNVKADAETTVKIEWLPHRSDMDPVEIEQLKRKTFDLERYNTNYAQIISKFIFYITARMDIKLIPKADGGDFQILSKSDEKASVGKPKWLQKDGMGYQIQSYVGKLTIVAKATVDGRIQLALRGIDVRNPEDKDKRIPFWIDYTKLIINEETLFDTITPVWHDKYYRHNMDVKADEEITIEVEWLPHRSDTVTVEESTNYQALLKKAELLEKQLATTEKNLKAEVKTLMNKTTALESLNSNYAQIFRNFSTYLTARMDIKLIPKTDGGDFQILSTSDDKASVEKPKWLQKDGIGYQIQSYVGKLTIVVKATVDGRIQLALRGINVLNPEDNATLIPYWIDYTKLIINEETLFDTLTPAWFGKSYRRNIDVKADREITIKVEWLPHRSDT